jgi:hypothetical protein
MNKHLSTAAAAIALVSAIGLAYAQTDPAAETTPANPDATAKQQQRDDAHAVRAGSTATPDWRTATDTADTPTAATPAAPVAADPTPAPVDNSSSMTTDNSAATTTDNSSTTTDNSASNTTDTTPAPMITEPAPKADRN